MSSIYGASGNDKLWFRGVNGNSDPAQNRVFGFSQTPKNSSNSIADVVSPSPTGGSGGGGGIFVGGFTDNSFFQGGSYSVGGVTQNYDFSIGDTNLSSDNSMQTAFDIQQDFTSFMFDPTYNNNFSYTTNQQFITNQDDTNNTNNTNNVSGINGGSFNFSGFTGVITTVKDVEYDDDAFTLTISYLDQTFNNGVLASSYERDSGVWHLTKLQTLYDWYQLGLTDPNYIIGTNVEINAAGDSLVQRYNEHNIYHGVIISAGPIDPLAEISPLTDCP